ncbi:MAG: YwbE family protein [Clostridia bacterium]
MNGQNRTDVKIGAKVKIVLKKDQPTGKLTDGIVFKLLTNSPHHPHGIKVMLDDGQVGRVQEICEYDNSLSENNK